MIRLGFPASRAQPDRGWMRWLAVPNSGTFFAAIAVITFIASWNAFLRPLVIGQDSSSWTVQVALSTFLTAQAINLHDCS